MLSGTIAALSNLLRPEAVDSAAQLVHIRGHHANGPAQHFPFQMGDRQGPLNPENHAGRHSVLGGLADRSREARLISRYAGRPLQL